MKKFTVCLTVLPILLLSTSALAWFGDIRSYDKFKCKYQMNSFGHKVEVCELIRTPPVSASAPVSTSTSKDDSSSSSDNNNRGHNRGSYGYGSYRSY